MTETIILAWWVLTGITEGTWQRQSREPAPYYFWGIEYHIWRLGQGGAIWLLAAPALGWIAALGWICIGSFIYERFLQLAQGDSFWDASKQYRIQNFIMPWSIWHDIGRLVLGIGLCLL